MNKNTLFFASAQIAERLVSFFMLPLLTNLVSRVEYAIWSQSIVISGILIPLVLLGFNTATIKFFPIWEGQEKTRKSVLLLMLSSVLIVMTVISSLAILSGRNTASLIFGDADQYMYIPVLAGLLLSEALFEMLVAVLRASNHIQRIAVYLLLKGVWRISIFLLVLAGTSGGFYKAFWVFVLFQLTVTIALYVKDVGLAALIRSGIGPGRNQWNEVFRFSLPLVPLAALTAANNFVDRLFLTHLYGLETLAVYSAAFSMAAIAAFFYSVLGFTLFPVLSKLWAGDDKEGAAVLMRKAFIIYLSLLLPFICFIAVIGGDVLLLLTSKDYLMPDYLLLLLSCNMGLFGIYQIAFYIFLLERGSAQAPFLMGGVVAANIFFNILLVPEYGMQGAALAGCISNALLAGLFLHKSQQISKWEFPWSAALKITVRAVSVGTLIWFIDRWLGSYSPIVLVLMLVCCGLVYVLLDYCDQRTSFFSVIRSN